MDGRDSPDDAERDEGAGYRVRRSSMSPPGTAYPDPRRRRAVVVEPNFGSLLGSSLSLVSALRGTWGSGGGGEGQQRTLAGQC